MKKSIVVGGSVAGALVLGACAWALTENSTRDEVVAETYSMAEVCKGAADVMVEKGHTKPFPEMLVPDVGAYGEGSQQEWNYLWQTKDPITVHCTDMAGVKKDVVLPAETKRCVLHVGTVSCGK